MYYLVTELFLQHLTGKFAPRLGFPKIRYKNVQYFNLWYAHKAKLGLSFQLPVLNFFFAPFLSFFAALSRFISFLGVNFGQSLGMGP